MDKIVQLIKNESTFFSGWLNSKKLGLALVYSGACAIAATETLTANPWAAAAIFGVGAIPASIYIWAQGSTEREAVKAASNKAAPSA